MNDNLKHIIQARAHIQHVEHSLGKLDEALYMMLYKEAALPDDHKVVLDFQNFLSELKRKLQNKEMALRD